jgi:hypothetical protein
VVLGHPQDVIAEVFQALSRLLGDLEGVGTALVAIPAVVGWRAVEANAVAFEDMSSIEGGEVLEHDGLLTKGGLSVVHTGEFFTPTAALEALTS